MKKIKVYVMMMRNANTNLPMYILRQSKGEMEKFKADAERDKRYYTYDINECEAESVRADDTVFAVKSYDNVGLRETIDITQPAPTYDEFIRHSLGM